MSCTCRTPKHLTNNEKNIETHFAYEDGDSYHGHMDATHLDIIIFFAKSNESIDHLIGYESVKKMIFSYWYLSLYEEWMLALAPMMRICLIDSATTHTIFKSNNFGLIMPLVNVSIILRFWLQNGDQRHN